MSVNLGASVVDDGLFLRKFFVTTPEADPGGVDRRECVLHLCRVIQRPNFAGSMIADGSHRFRLVFVAGTAQIHELFQDRIPRGELFESLAPTEFNRVRFRPFFSFARNLIAGSSLHNEWNPPGTAARARPRDTGNLLVENKTAIGGLSDATDSSGIPGMLGTSQTLRAGVHRKKTPSAGSCCAQQDRLQRI